MCVSQRKRERNSICAMMFSEMLTCRIGDLLESMVIRGGGERERERERERGGGGNSLVQNTILIDRLM